jgi:4-aminobutyrate aminotransferase/4-aminobutyrate aminotransferase/(S)-3-amino-2-methylpropionate transaminase
VDKQNSQPCGPAELLRLKREYLIPCVYHFYKDPPQIVGGEGSYLIDHTGRRYLDFYSGVTVMSAGHCNAAIIEPAIEQIRKLQHTTSIYLTEPILRLAEMLAQITPGDLTRSFFCASGSEAIEGALLLASIYTHRAGIVATTNSLHGRTRWAMNATGLDMWRTDPFPLPGVHRVAFGDSDVLRKYFESAETLPAAFIAEPIEGNGGIIVPPPDYWPTVRMLCDSYGVLLILDEVQTGMNRTGKWFACQNWGVVPDILVTSKALGNGFPISAFITTPTIAANYTRPGASTYGGNPVSATAALATLRFHQSNDLGSRSQRMGELLKNEIAAATVDFPRVRPPHGMGLMIGLFVQDESGNANGALCDALMEALKDHGVFVGKTGPGRSTLTFMPPLTVSGKEIGEFGIALRKSIDSLR